MLLLAIWAATVASGWVLWASRVLARGLLALATDALRTKSEDLVIALQTAAPKIGLNAPTLEDLTQ